MNVLRQWESGPQSAFDILSPSCLVVGAVDRIREFAQSSILHSEFRQMQQSVLQPLASPHGDLLRRGRLYADARSCIVAVQWV